MAEMPALMYIHGFNSSPQSLKARQMADAMHSLGRVSDLYVPELPFNPKRALAILTEQIEQLLPRPVVLVGSSIGGYLATCLADRYQLKAVLINPAVRPYELLRNYLGPHENPYTGERYDLTENDADQLLMMDVEVVKREEDFLVLLQAGDETLDYQQAWGKYQQCSIYKGLGGSHGFDYFEDYIPMIFRFAGITGE